MFVYLYIDVGSARRPALCNSHPRSFRSLTCHYSIAERDSDFNGVSIGAYAAGHHKFLSSDGYVSMYLGTHTIKNDARHKVTEASRKCRLWLE